MFLPAQIISTLRLSLTAPTSLAERVGTTQSIISDLEDAEYQGHSMSMLRRIAAALGLSVRVEFVDAAA